MSSENQDEVKSLGSPTESEIIRKMEGEIKIHDDMIEDVGVIPTKNPFSYRIISNTTVFLKVKELMT